MDKNDFNKLELICRDNNIEFDPENIFSETNFKLNVNQKKVIIKSHKKNPNKWNSLCRYFIENNIKYLLFSMALNNPYAKILYCNNLLQENFNENVNGCLKIIKPISFYPYSIKIMLDISNKTNNEKILREICDIFEEDGDHLNCFKVKLRCCIFCAMHKFYDLTIEDIEELNLSNEIVNEIVNEFEIVPDCYSNKFLKGLKKFFIYYKPENMLDTLEQIEEIYEEYNTDSEMEDTDNDDNDNNSIYFNGSIKEVIEFCKKNMDFNKEMIYEWNKIGFDIKENYMLKMKFNLFNYITIKEINNSYSNFLLSFFKNKDTNKNLNISFRDNNPLAKLKYFYELNHKLKSEFYDKDLTDFIQKKIVLIANDLLYINDKNIYQYLINYYGKINDKNKMEEILNDGISKGLEIKKHYPKINIKR